MGFFNRKQKESGPCIPIGPNFKSAKRESTLLSGSKLSVCLNRHTPIVPSEPQVKPKQSYNIFTDAAYKKEIASDFEYFRLLTWCGKFRKAVFSSYVGHLELAVTVKKRPPCARDKSLLIPCAFESYVLSEITRNYGHDFYHGKSTYEAPYNWQVHDHLPVPSMSYELRPVMGPDHSRRVYFEFSLDHDVCVLFNFGFGQYEPGSLSQKDAAISPEPLYELTWQIINSITLEPSASLREEIEKIKRSYPDSKLSQDVKPLKWSTPEQDAEWEEYQRQEAERKQRFKEIREEGNKPEVRALEEKLMNASAEELTRLMEQAMEEERNNPDAKPLMVEFTAEELAQFMDVPPEEEKKQSDADAKNKDRG
ncbi:hypothetical protein EUZ85_09970 [Hahella sp. KA22]|uniref:hypothetical protein n=1 Tax=Hahella sp. KA22 TaxID=1628392 RepID=UPI000FDD6C30|nr:hypothetical protein [Hahella sp. KA22]AZZ91030.1 hypothetical protein ENC22_07415 [Hahella sp. KA22]QAY54400.1 hypothetical protein EUZ85_09970 [Hahella sp. KA22]